MFSHKHQISPEEHDAKTRKAQGAKFTITIDGSTVAFSKGQTIMQAAMAAGIYIPHLCHYPEFSPHGSCRVCTVTVDGRNAAACTMPATAGQQVLNNTTELNRLRRTLVQMLFVEGNHICPACEQSGACQLQAVAYYTQMLSPHYKHFFPQRTLDGTHPDVIIDFNRCILCELCVRASRDVDAKEVFAISGRGLDAHLVVNSPTGKLGDSDFSATDKAADVCPVGAILLKHQGYREPIGQRLYDRHPISVVGDVHARKRNEKDGR
jgi:[NiFe] hydrogenase diaphorase moiety small subunit